MMQLLTLTSWLQSLFTSNDRCVVSAEAVAAAAMTPPEAAALPGGSAAQRENLKKAQQKQREGAVWRQTASCICANLSVYWRREGAEFPSTPTAGLHTLSAQSCILKDAPSYKDLNTLQQQQQLYAGARMLSHASYLCESACQLSDIKHSLILPWQLLLSAVLLAAKSRAKDAQHAKPSL